MALFLLLTRRDPETDCCMQGPKIAASMYLKNMKLAPSFQKIRFANIF